MMAVVGGLGAAIIWSLGTAYSSRAARALGPQLTLAWVMLIGLVALAAVLPFSGGVRLSASTVVWLALGGIGNVGGLLILYHSFRIGQMGVVMPIAGTEGGIAALISILAGQRVGALAAVALAATVIGVVMTAIVRRPVSGVPASATPPSRAAGKWPSPRGHEDRRAAIWACAAALSFGVSLFATGRAGTLLPPAWAVMPPRVVGVLVVTIPIALRGRLHCPPAALRLLAIAGVCEVGGFFAYALGARHGIAVAAVLATLTGAISAGVGRLLYGERLHATQLAGIAVISAGVATLSAITA